MRILAADLSLRCPGFALIDCDDGRASIVKLCHIDSHGRKGCHGEILSEIADVLKKLISTADIFVREKGFYRFPQETQTLYKVVGVTDMVLWDKRHSVFEELAPTTVKKLLTGNGKATKDEVAAA